MLQGFCDNNRFYLLLSAQFLCVLYHMAEAFMQNRHIKIFLFPFSTCNVVIVVYCVSYIACINTIYLSQMTTTGDCIPFLLNHLATSARNASRKYITEAVVWSQVRYVATVNGELIHIEQRWAYLFPHYASSRIEINVLLASFLIYVYTPLWPKKDLFWV